MLRAVYIVYRFASWLKCENEKSNYAVCFVSLCRVYINTGLHIDDVAHDDRLTDVARRWLLNFILLGSDASGVDLHNYKYGLFREKCRKRVTDSCRDPIALGCGKMYRKNCFSRTHKIQNRF